MIYLINNYLFYDSVLYIGSDALSIDNNTNVQDSYLITNDCIYKISGLESKLPILKSLYRIFY